MQDDRTGKLQRLDDLKAKKRRLLEDVSDPAPCALSLL